MKIQIRIKHLATGEIYESKIHEDMNEDDLENLKNIFKDDDAYLTMLDPDGDHICMSSALLRQCVKMLIIL